MASKKSDKKSEKVSKVLTGDDMFIHATMESLREKLTNSNDGSARKRRQKTSGDQLFILQEAFDNDPRPTATARKELAQRVGMTPRAVQIWFQNRRAKFKAAGGILPPTFRRITSSKGSAVGASSSLTLDSSMLKREDAPSNLFADLPKQAQYHEGLPASLLPANRILSEFVSDSDDDSASVASSLLSSSSVSTLGMSQLNLSSYTPSLASHSSSSSAGSAKKNSVYGNLSFTRSLPDLKSMKVRGGVLHGSSHLNTCSSAWGDDDDDSDAQSTDGNANERSIEEPLSSTSLPVSPRMYAASLQNSVKTTETSAVAPYPVAGMMDPFVFGANGDMQLPLHPYPDVDASDAAVPRSAGDDHAEGFVHELSSPIRTRRRHSLHAEFNSSNDSLPPNVLLQLQNNYLSLQQAQVDLSNQSSLKQQRQPFIANAACSPAMPPASAPIFPEAYATFIQSPAASLISGSNTGASSPEIERAFTTTTAQPIAYLHPAPDAAPLAPFTVSDLIPGASASFLTDLGTPLTSLAAPFHAIHPHGLLQMDGEPSFAALLAPSSAMEEEMRKLIANAMAREQAAKVTA
ncbi:hypothetical protein HDU96_002734 [Phlyctochytrium bullatum]|nr:hypothetical protein HDU96_002734 [Phlyctochytrium bullatum]